MKVKLHEESSTLSHMLYFHRCGKPETMKYIWDCTAWIAWAPPHCSGSVCPRMHCVCALEWVKCRGQDKTLSLKSVCILDTI